MSNTITTGLLEEKFICPECDLFFIDEKIFKNHFIYHFKIIHIKFYIDLSIKYLFLFNQI